jgi:two-component system cell cycle response regulator
VQLRRPAVLDGLRFIAVPLGFGAVSLGLLAYGSLAGMNPLAVALATASLVAVMGRLMLTFRENVAVLTTSRAEASADALTGLGNRRALARELEHRLAAADDGNPLVLVLFDLDGFKQYNDTFGHPAGDALLARLGGTLETYLKGRGVAYRMGGDEFCALLRPATRWQSPSSAAPPAH